MSERARVDEVLTALLELCTPLEHFDMPLLDAHDATLAEDIYAGERLVMKSGTRIRATQIGLAASIGLDHLPTRPHPRVVVISAGPDLVEPGLPLKSDEEYETNSWLLTTAVREVGAVAYRVHSIPDDEEELQAVIEDQLVRADLIIISGERHDDSFDLITRTLQRIGEIKTVEIAIESSGRHNYGVIGPDKTPVVTLPGDPIAELLARGVFPGWMARVGDANELRSERSLPERNLVRGMGLRRDCHVLAPRDERADDRDREGQTNPEAHGSSLGRTSL